MTHVAPDHEHDRTPTFFERNASMIMWVVGTIASVLMLYGDLRVADAETTKDIANLRSERAAHEVAISQQLDRIEQRLQSIDEYLRRHQLTETIPVSSK